MFRFKQRLSTILGDRKLNSSERAGLDAYDIELEDALSNTGGGGDSLWESVDGDLHPITDPARLFVNAVGDSIDLHSDTLARFVTTAGAAINLTADGPILGTSNTNVGFTAAGNITLNATGDLVVLSLPTSDPGIPGAIYSLLGVLHISP